MFRYGFALVWVGVVTAVLFGASGCDTFVSPSHQLPPPTPIGGPASTPNPTLAGPPPTVVPLAGQPIQGFRFDMVISDTTTLGTEVTRMTGEWTVEAVHMVTTISTAEGDQTSESYLIGGTAYYQDPQGNWLQGPSGNPEFHTLMNPTLVLRQTWEEGNLVLTPLGTATVGDVACARYQVSAQGPTAEAGSLFTQGIATVGLADGWVYRFEFERSDPDIRSQGVMSCGDYNTGIVIEPPI